MLYYQLFCQNCHETFLVLLLPSGIVAPLLLLLLLECACGPPSSPFPSLSICGKRTTTRIGRKKSKAAPALTIFPWEERERSAVHPPPTHLSAQSKQNRAADQFVFGIGIIIHRYRVARSVVAALRSLPHQNTRPADTVARMQSS